MTSFTLTADDNGQVPMTICPGTAHGEWPLDAAETADSSVSNSITFPFDASGSSRLPPLDELATSLYNGIRNGRGGTQTPIFVQLNNLFSTEAEIQDVLLQWLIASGHSSFQSTDFGPVNYTTRATPGSCSTPTDPPPRASA